MDISLSAYKRLIPIGVVGLLFVCAFAWFLHGTVVRNNPTPTPGSNTPFPIPGTQKSTPSPQGTGTSAASSLGTPFTLLGDEGDPAATGEGDIRSFPPAPPVSEPTPANWVVSIEDDFSKPDKLAIPEIKQQNMTAKYYSGSYQLFIKEVGKMAFVSKDISATNVKIDVDAKLVAGSRMNYFGVMCRFLDRKNFYYLAVSSGGAYGVGKVVNGVRTSLLPDEFMPSKAVKKDQGEVNHITAICNGQKLYLYVNDVLVSSVTDGDLMGGTRFGFLASSQEADGTNIFFDNLKIATVQ